MSKRLITIFWLFISSHAMAIDMNFIRSTYERAVNSEEQANHLLVYLSKQTQIAIIKGYRGATKIVLAKHYKNPYNKLKSFNDGKEILESAIKEQRHDVELIFLRFSIQQQAPDILGYNKNFKPDYSLLYAALINESIADDKLKSLIYFYLLENKTTPQQDKQKLQNVWNR